MARTEGSTASAAVSAALAVGAMPCLVLALSFAGCADSASDCEARGDCLVPGPVGTGGAGGGEPAACTPSELGTGEAPVDECGAFVSFSLGDDADATGTKSAPYATVRKALASGARRLYLCGERFDEAIELPAGTTIYGALVCGEGWRYEPSVRTTLAPSAARLDAVAAPAVVLLTAAAAPCSIYDVDVEAPDADDPSESSVAVIVEAGELRIERGHIAAGRGAAGADGASESEAALAGTAGNDGTAACLVEAPTPAAAAVVTSCADGDSTGGASGMGGVSTGYDAEPGLPAGEQGAPGLGQTSVGGGDWSCETGGNGQDGAPGEVGEAGAGASSGESVGPSGFVGAAGTAGHPGGRGQGGGGGGGTRNEWSAGYACGNATEGGASGGSGGAGGCGGTGGGGGQPGGASIALLSLAATVTLVDCRLTAADGGAGGAGGNGQVGGAGGAAGIGGGNGGSGAAVGCVGGTGGVGGAGGAGGGGGGGPSIAIAYAGALPVYEGDTELVVASGGAGGPGGDSNVADNAGLAGEASPTRSFD